MSKSPGIIIRKKHDKINITQLETPTGIDKLKRDGFTREDVSKALYNRTDGANVTLRTEIMSRLHGWDLKK